MRLLLQVLGCACYADAGTAADGIRCGEITAIIIHPSYRRAGFGDSLLDFVEQVDLLGTAFLVRSFCAQSSGLG